MGDIYRLTGLLFGLRHGNHFVVRFFVVRVRQLTVGSLFFSEIRYLALRGVSLSLLLGRALLLEIPADLLHLLCERANCLR